ncbi:MAG: nucleotide sugar dehydrogenase, partial [candidate division WOR-3 bacterium]|nr:nucleotide sugar dehydrogenase [candidate division WOR-3 bacterium]
HVLAVRSTVPPGTTAKIVIPTIEKYSGKKAGVDFGVCVNPEFLREGSSVYDFYNPPFTLIGQSDEKSGNVVAKVFQELKSPVVKTKPEVAEMVKYVNNAFHALKISFANEVGNLCKELNIDSHEVMAIFCRDGKLNLSPYYLKPGFAFGGSCLPKDLRALIYEIGRNNLLSPILSSILPSNNNQIERGANLILETGKRKIGILGLSFKVGTDDLRESPMVKLVSLLIEKGLKVRIYDSKVMIDKLLGTNKEYIEKEIPYIVSLMSPSCEEVVKKSEVIVVGQRTREFQKIAGLLKPDQILIDLVRIVQNPTRVGSHYKGICW